MYKDLEKLIKTEKLEKGSRQRKMPFDPVNNVSDQERESVQNWSEGQDFDAKQNMPEMNPNARKRHLMRIAQQTQTKVNPETGKMMYLMHRGMSGEEYNKLKESGFNKDYVSGFTPNYNIASEFSEAHNTGMRQPIDEDEQAELDEFGYFTDEMGQRNYGKETLPRQVLSAWISEDDIQHIPQAIGTSSRDFMEQDMDNKYLDQEEARRKEKWDTKLAPKKSAEFDGKEKANFIEQMTDEHYWNQVQEHADKNNFEGDLEEYEANLLPEDKEGFAYSAKEWAEEDYPGYKEDNLDLEYESQDRPLAPSAFKNQTEIMVKPHQLMVESDEEREARLAPNPKKEMNEKINRREAMKEKLMANARSRMKTMTASEKMFSTEEAFKMGTNMLLKKCIENTDNMGVEELRKNWRKGVANLVGILGLTHAAHYMGQPGVEQLSERQKSPIYQRVQQKMDAKAANRNPSNNLSVEDQVKQARKQGRAEGQAIIDKNYENSRDQIIDDYLYSVSGAESSFGKNTKHKKMTSGIHNNTSAFGSYGLMPNTVVEMANRMDRNNPLKAYNKMSPTEIHQSLKENPDHEYKIAKFMANHLYDKHNGDLAKMAYVRTMGHNLAPEELEEGGSHANWKNHSYPQKVMKFYNKLQDSKKNKKPQDLNNASNNPM